MQLLRNPSILAILLLGFGLRVFRLDGQSLWSDEGNSVFMTGRGFGEIVQAAASDIHPPLYYLVLRYWSIPVGTSEFAVRFLSLIFGVLLVALIFSLGRRLAGRDVGLVAAFLAATSPLLIYYSQEARMYSQMAAFSALSVLFAVRLWGNMIGEKGKGREGKRGPLNPLPSSSLILYVLSTVAALYTQYFSFTVLVFENIAFALIALLSWRSWRSWGPWVAAQLAIVVLYLPWLSQVYRNASTWPAVSEAFSFQTLMYRAFSAFSFGLSGDEVSLESQAIVALLLTAGVVVGWRVERRGERENAPVHPQPSTLHVLPFSLLFLFVPVGLMYLLSLQRPMYNPKFLLLAIPPYHILLALGITGIGEAVKGLARYVRPSISASPLAGSLKASVVLLALVGVLYAIGRPLGAYYFDPKYARDDYRGLSRHIEISSQESDAIILDAPGQMETFGYYYKEPLQVMPLPRQRPIDEKATIEELSRLASGHRRIWAVFWGDREADPSSIVERWLNENTFRAGNRWYGNVRLVMYSVPATPAAGIPAQAGTKQIEANLGNRISLLGYSLGASGGSADVYEAKPGEVLQLTLFWKGLSKVEERYVVFTHLLDPHEHIWGQRDAEPGSGSKPTSSWMPGVVVSDNYGIPIVRGTPPGDYYVEIGLYLPATGQRLPVVGVGGEAKGDRVLFGPIRVGRAESPPHIESLLIQYPLTADFGSLRLVGYELNKLGFDQDNLDFHRGDIARLAFLWQARERPRVDYDIIVRVLDRSDQVVLTKRNSPADGNYPTTQWSEGEVVLDQHKLPLDLPPGNYRLVLGLVDAQKPLSEVGKTLTVREITIR